MYLVVIRQVSIVTAIITAADFLANPRNINDKKSGTGITYRSLLCYNHDLSKKIQKM